MFFRTFYSVGIVLLSHLDFKEKLGEKARWKLIKNDAWFWKKNRKQPPTQQQLCGYLLLSCRISKSDEQDILDTGKEARINS